MSFPLILKIENLEKISVGRENRHSGQAKRDPESRFFNSQGTSIESGQIKQ
jgi:hypothetical protein